MMQTQNSKKGIQHISTIQTLLYYWLLKCEIQKNEKEKFKHFTYYNYYDAYIIYLQ